jgi:hypothetical protein
MRPGRLIGRGETASVLHDDAVTAAPGIVRPLAFPQTVGIAHRSFRSKRAKSATDQPNDVPYARLAGSKKSADK